jgi:hypothetical protein
MGFLRRLMESRPFLGRVPDQSLIASGQSDDTEHLRATRGQGYAFIYVPTGRPFAVRLGTISGATANAWWFNPRDGATYDAAGKRRGDPVAALENRDVREFDPPGEPAEGADWVLVLDDVGRRFPAPGKPCGEDRARRHDG